MGCSEPSALVTRSNRQLRQLLSASGATFAQATAAGSAAHDGRPGSQLLLRGCKSVHALHLVLLQQSWCGGPEQPDVPVILAPVPFVGASLQPLKLQVRIGGRDVGAVILGSHCTCASLGCR